jgi:hypothetical protein
MDRTTYQYFSVSTGEAMTATIPNLWPEDIKVDVLPPLTILKYQAAKLREITKGILEAEVTTVSGPEDFATHRLDLIAPVLEGRSTRVLSVTHRVDFYPVVLEAECFRPKPAPTTFGHVLGTAGIAASVAAALGSKVPPTWPNPDDWRPVANDQEELLKRIGEVLKSRQVRATIDSLIALSNEKNQPGEESAPAA